MAVLLLVATGLAALPWAFTRAVLGLVVGWFVVALTGLDGAMWWAAAAFAAWPYLVAVEAFLDLGFSRRRWLRKTRGRFPTDLEVNRVEPRLVELKSRGARLPARWAVLGGDPNGAAVRGRTLLVGSTLIASPLLEGVLGHELGHLSGPLPDGRVLAAYGRLRPRVPGVIRRAWAVYLRHREYRADREAGALGVGPDFAELLATFGANRDWHGPWWDEESTHPRAGRRLKRMRRRMTPAGRGL